MNVASRTRSCLFKKECGICRERLRRSLFISTTGCAHEYCTDCCKRHAEVKFMTGSSQIKCPHENCEQNYNAHQCRRLLSQPNYRILKKRREEAAIPPTLRFYCPFKDCLAFMKKPETGTFFQCVACRRGVCLECNVPWHANQSCGESRAEMENSRLLGDQKLRELAKQMRWQTCLQCRRVIERTTGCNYMVCLCRNQFCYRCGARYGNCRC